MAWLQLLATSTLPQMPTKISEVYNNPPEPPPYLSPVGPDGKIRPNAPEPDPATSDEEIAETIFVAAALRAGAAVVHGTHCF